MKQLSKIKRHLKVFAALTVIGTLVLLCLVFGYDTLTSKIFGLGVTMNSSHSAVSKLPAVLPDSAAVSALTPLSSAPTSALTGQPTNQPTNQPTKRPTPEPEMTATPEPVKQTITPMPTAAERDPSQIIYRGNSKKAQIAFTFDDSGVNMENILKILDEKGIKGTFFLTAGEFERDPELWRQAVKDGHQICNHTVSHPLNLKNLSDDKIRQEILGWEAAAKAVLGDEYVKDMKSNFSFFRSPGGNRSDRLQGIIGELGYSKTIYWSCEDCYFATHNPKNISLSQHYIDDAKNGAIFLLHPGDWTSLQRIIDGVEAKGYSFKLLSEILG